MTGAKTFNDRSVGDLPLGFEEPAGWPSFALALLNASSDGVLLIDMDGKVIAANPASLRLLQFERPRDVAWDSLWDEKDRLSVRTSMEAAKAGARATFEGRRGSRWLRGIVEPVRDESARIRCLLVCAHDVEARAPHEDKLKSFDRVVGTVVHDFNNIFASVQSAVRMLRRRVTDAPALEIVAHLESAAQRGCALSTQLLDFAREEETPCDAPRPQDSLAERTTPAPKSDSPTKPA